MANNKGYSDCSHGHSAFCYETLYISTVYNNVYASGIAINIGNMQYACGVRSSQRLVLVKTLLVLQFLFTYNE